MNTKDELPKLQELRSSGALTDEEEALKLFVLRVRQIVAGSLLAGLIVFLAIVLFIVHVKNNGQVSGPLADWPVTTFVASLFALMIFAQAFVFPWILTRTALQTMIKGTGTPFGAVMAGATDTDVVKLMRAWQTTDLIMLGLLASAGVVGCIAYHMEPNILDLAIVAVAVALMLYKFPTEKRLRAWLNRQVDVLAGLRRQSGDTAGR
jgi:hypothetical protein